MSDANKSRQELIDELVCLRKQVTRLQVENSLTNVTSRQSKGSRPAEEEQTHRLAGQESTERKRMELALQESETRFRTLAEMTTAAILIYQGTKLRYVNPATAAITGYSRAELLAMDFLKLVHPDARALAQERRLARQQGKQVSSRYELKLLTKTGHECWVDITLGLIEFEGGLG